MIHKKKSHLIFLGLVQLFLLSFHGLCVGITVKLVGKGDKKIDVPPEVAKFSQKITDEIEIANQNTSCLEIPIKDVEGKILENIVKLLGQINDFSSEDKYVPRQLQPIVNEKLGLYNLTERAQFLHAVEELEIDFLRNAIMGYTVDKIHEQDPIMAQNLEDGICALQKIWKEKFDWISEETLKYIEKHFILRSNCINEECSIADYLNLHGIFFRKINGKYECSFPEEKLTSLFGVSRLLTYLPEDANFILLTLCGAHHCLFGSNFDLQFPESPFKAFGDQLNRLYLSENKYLDLDLGIFDGLSNLELLTLDYEVLKDKIFNAIKNNGNIFKNLKLNDLLLNGNQDNISKSELEGIQKFVPNTRIFF